MRRSRVKLRRQQVRLRRRLCEFSRSAQRAPRESQWPRRQHEKYAPALPEQPTRTVYLQRWLTPHPPPRIFRQDNAETDDRATAMARYKVFAREKGTRLIERTERVLVEGTPRRTAR